MTSIPTTIKTSALSSLSSLESIMYLFHHKEQQSKHSSFDLNSMKHSSQVISIDWKTLRKQTQNLKTISLETKNEETKSDLNSEKVNISIISNAERGLKWNNEYFHSKLQTKWLGQTFSFCDTLSSTQTFMKSNAENLPSGTLCACNTQTCGRGRGGNVWESPKGCLMFSFTADLPSSKARVLPAMQYLISVAMVQTILQLTENRLQLQLKWPNDIYFSSDQKIGGVLCESLYLQASNKYRVIAGIGLNVDNEQPTTCISKIVRDLKCNENGINREDVLSTFCNTFECMFDDFCHLGFTDLHRKQYLQYWMHSGQKVTVVESDSVMSKEVTITGINKYGLLLAENAIGEAFELNPNGNSFDFMKGLICRKIQNLSVKY